MYFVYIIYSHSIDKYYVGVTSNLSTRVEKHNRKHRGFTGRSNDWKLAYYESFITKSLALLRENEIKKWKSRTKILSLISQ